VAVKNKIMTDNTILMVVDDDKDDRFFFRSAVKKDHPLWQCQEAEGGEDALSKLRSKGQLPDFIFLDLNMPLMSGQECLAELKKDINLKNIPVIVYSTSHYREDVKTAYALGAAYYLNKLSDIYMLPEEITKAVNKAVEAVAG
jgi:CheY-like chemotaxis protein